MSQHEHTAGGGGNTTLVNQDEKAILDACVSGVPVQTVGHQADDSHITAPFREPAVGGA
jgi:hypothetical protein